MVRVIRLAPEQKVTVGGREDPARPVRLGSRLQRLRHVVLAHTPHTGSDRINSTDPANGHRPNRPNLPGLRSVAAVGLRPHYGRRREFDERV